jgi:hypothetical protein
LSSPLALPRAARGAAALACARLLRQAGEVAGRRRARIEAAGAVGVLRPRLPLEAAAALVWRCVGGALATACARGVGAGVGSGGVASESLACAQTLLNALIAEAAAADAPLHHLRACVQSACAAAAAARTNAATLLIAALRAAQKAQTQAAIKQFQPSFGSPIVTEVAPTSRFWPAEAYHQDYFRRNPNQGYCRIVIAPKLKKLGLPGGK